MKVITTIILLLLTITTAEARQRHATAGRAAECNVTMPCDFSYDAPRRSSARPDRVQRVIVRQVTRVARQAPQKVREVNIAPARNVETAPAGHTLSRPSRFIPGRLICAVNVGVALAERGIKGTGSALAMSYRHWGRSAGGPVPGAVIVSPRRGGGHVAIVSRVVNGVVYAWNATGGQSGWREIPYRHHVIDYRVPG